VRVRAVDAAGVRERPDRLVTEEPMEIRAHGPGQEPEPLAVTMRTPGHDFELAVGFCRTEGLLAGHESLAAVAYCMGPEGDQEYNVVTVRLRAPLDASALRRGALLTSASCGLCGTATLEQVQLECRPVEAGPVVSRAVVAGLVDAARGAQPVFDATGGLHASALFDATGALLVAREDVGRHNALDKVVGWALLEDRLPLSGHLLFVSGRVSFEIVQKAAMAGIPIVCAVSAPSSLAVAAADRLGMTLVGFVRDERFNVYTHAERVDLDA
jgi:FdhD protein